MKNKKIKHFLIPGALGLLLVFQVQESYAQEEPISTNELVEVTDNGTNEPINKLELVEKKETDLDNEKVDINAEEKIELDTQEDAKVEKDEEETEAIEEILDSKEKEPALSKKDILEVSQEDPRIRLYAANSEDKIPHPRSDSSVPKMPAKGGLPPDELLGAVDVSPVGDAIEGEDDNGNPIWTYEYLIKVRPRYYYNYASHSSYSIVMPKFVEDVKFDLVGTYDLDFEKTPIEKNIELGVKDLEIAEDGSFDESDNFISHSIENTEDGKGKILEVKSQEDADILLDNFDRKDRKDKDGKEITPKSKIDFARTRVYAFSAVDNATLRTKFILNEAQKEKTPNIPVDVRLLYRGISEKPDPEGDNSLAKSDISSDSKNSYTRYRKLTAINRETGETIPEDEYDPNNENHIKTYYRYIEHPELIIEGTFDKHGLKVEPGVARTKYNKHWYYLGGDIDLNKEVIDDYYNQSEPKDWDQYYDSVPRYRNEGYSNAFWGARGEDYTDIGVVKAEKTLKAAELLPSFEMIEAAPLEPSFEMIEAAPLEPSFEMIEAAPLEPSFEMIEAAPLEPSFELIDSAPLEPSFEMIEAAPLVPSFEVLPAAQLEPSFEKDEISKDDLKEIVEGLRENTKKQKDLILANEKELNSDKTDRSKDEKSKANEDRELSNDNKNKPSKDLEKTKDQSKAEAKGNLASKESLAAKKGSNPKTGIPGLGSVGAILIGSIAGLFASKKKED